jgi:hypothetical protein
MSLILFHTQGCHLCEDAHALVLAALARQGLSPDGLEQVEIADSPDLLERYGVTIPVLRENTSGRELNWPFGLEEIGRLIAER